jgi:hypothetical protein
MDFAPWFYVAVRQYQIVLGLDASYLYKQISKTRVHQRSKGRNLHRTDCEEESAMTEFPILNLNNWTKLLNGGGCLVMLVFETSWSDSAQRVLEVADSLFRQYRPELSVVRVQIDQDPDIDLLFGVTSVPYTVFTREADVAGSVEGLQSYDVYERAVAALLERTQAPV